MVLQNMSKSKTEVDNMNKMLHLAAQYLAAAGKSFLTVMPDGSQSNLEFCAEGEKCLKTKELNTDGDTLRLYYDDFSLEWKSHMLLNKRIKLDGVSHEYIVNWISETAKEVGMIHPFKYTYNNDLPYPEIQNDFVYKLLNKRELKQLSEYRLLAQNVLAQIIKEHNLNARIRIWPTDFDTSVYTLLNSYNDVSIGFGMAVMDPVESDKVEHYLYTSGWQGLQNIQTEEFPKLKIGGWQTSSWSGATFSLKDANQFDKSVVTKFFNDTLQVYKNRYYREVI